MTPVLEIEPSYHIVLVHQVLGIMVLLPVWNVTIDVPPVKDLPLTVLLVLELEPQLMNVHAQILIMKKLTAPVKSVLTNV